MNKFIASTLCVLALAVAPKSASAGEWAWNWWTTSPDNSQTEFTGCALGFASEYKSVKGAQISAIMSKAEKVKSGCQFAIGYCRATTLRNGCQLAFFTRSDKAALQFGLLNFNKEGFLPFFPFFNFSTKGTFGVIEN